MLSFDTDDVLYQVLSASAELKKELSGGVYAGERPENSAKEDVTVNNIIVTREKPQSGTSNVNIHVPDLKLRISGQEQYKADRERLRKLTALVVSILEAATIEGLTFWITNDSVIKEPQIPQHYTNLRVEWNIH